MARTGLIGLALGMLLWPESSYAQRTASVESGFSVAHRVALMSQVLAFHDALLRENTAWLEKHVLWPIPASWIEYSMEVKTRYRWFTHPGEMVRHKERWRLPEGFLQTLRKSALVYQGVEHCGKSAVWADYESGPPAFRVEGSRAWVSYLAQPCEAETHVVTLEFQATGAKWKLVRRTVAR